MGYAVVDPDDLPVADEPERAADKRSISGELGLQNLGAHVYDVEPGEAIPLAYHVHDEQEELFYVLAGTLSVETPEGPLTVEAGQLLVVEPESPQRTFVAEDAGESARVLVIGAPAIDDVHAYEP